MKKQLPKKHPESNKPVIDVPEHTYLLKDAPVIDVPEHTYLLKDAWYRKMLKQIIANKLDKENESDILQ